MEILSQGTVREVGRLIIRLAREAVIGMNFVSRVILNGCYLNSFSSDGISKPSETLNRLVFDLPNPIDNLP